MAPAIPSAPPLILALAAAAALALVAALLRWAARALPRALEGLAPVPALSFPLDEAEAHDVIDAPLHTPPPRPPTSTIPCYDPATMQSLGTVPAMTPDEVRAAITACRAAQAQWATTTFAQRRALLRVLLKYVVDNQETLCRVAARDSGKPRVDAAFGEVMTTCEKLWWLIGEGEAALAPEPRSAGRMMFYKRARVEYAPVGVVGAIVPWNYPVHNVLNPVTAALFAGNGIVVKVSEHAAWSSKFMAKLVAAALAAVAAPPDLVRIVTGYGDAGAALVSGGVDHCIFVGSTGVGRAVARGAADTLTPLTLELGGKDAFIVTEDADLDAAVATGLRGAFQSCGQNCAGAERFIVAAPVAKKFADAAAAVARSLRQGNPLGPAPVDAGAMCMPGAAAKVEALVRDAVRQGAVLLAGGAAADDGRGGQFMRPTVLYGVTPAMALWREEVFGPVLAVTPAANDDEAVALANDCAFGLGSAVFARSPARARAIGARLVAGSTSLNDFATTYMCQSLPFGGVKESGYGRFAGVEGLRGLCVAKAVAEDAVPWLIRTSIPPVLRYPIAPGGFTFVTGLIRLFYAPTWGGVVGGVRDVVKGLMMGPTAAGAAPATAARGEIKSD